MAETIPSNLLPGWRPVLIAMLVLRETVRIGAYVSGLSILLSLIVDRSDRGLADLVFAAAQGVLAIAAAIAAVSCWFGPKDSWTSRRAKSTCILLGAFLTAVLLFGAGSREVEDWMSLSFGARLEVFVIVLLSALVALAVIGFAWLSVHEAIGRECRDPRLIRAAHRLIGAWCLYWLATFTLIFSTGLLSEAPGWMMQTGLVVFETLYFRLVRDSCSSIRANLAVAGAHASGNLTNNPI